jgi:F-type H+-transporting ATPase subunit a
MTKRLAILGFILVFLAGFVFLRGPTPHISIRAEALTSVGGVSITNTMITGWVIVVLIAAGLFLATRKWTLVPSGIQNFVEAAFEAFYNLVTGIAGEENGRRFFPVVATIFFFIVISNWLSLTPVFNVIGWVGHEEDPAVQIEEHGFVEGIIFDDAGPFYFIPLSDPGNLRVTSDKSVIELDEPVEAQEKYDEAVADGKKVGELIPLFRGINTDLNTPLAIAIVSAIAVEFWGISALGFFRYGSKFINFSSPINAFVGLLELVSELVRLVSFTFRLFGNMFAGEVVILMFTFLTPLILTLPFYGLEIFVGAIQAFIFSMLTLVFGVMAVSHHGDEHSEEAKHGAEHGTADEAVHEAMTEPA